MAYALAGYAIRGGTRLKSDCTLKTGIALGFPLRRAEALEGALVLMRPSFTSLFAAPGRACRGTPSMGQSGDAGVFTLIHL